MKKWKMPDRKTLLHWISALKIPRNWRRMTEWEHEFVLGFIMNMKFMDFVPTREKVEKLEEIYAERT